MASLPTSAVAAEPGRERTTEVPLTVPFTWSVHLLRREPRRLPRLCAALLAVFVLGLCVFHSFWLALLPALAVLFSLSEWALPARYTLSARSASVRHGLTALEIGWADVRHAYLCDDGVKLSPLRHRNSRWEPLRGVFLRFDSSNRDAVIEAVRRLRAEANGERPEVDK